MLKRIVAAGLLLLVGCPSRTPSVGAGPRSFCEGTKPGGFCEGFEAPEGGIPKGWEGGEGLAIKKDEYGTFGLEPFEERPSYHLAVKQPLGTKFKVEVYLRPCALTSITLGNARADIEPGVPDIISGNHGYAISVARIAIAGDGTPPDEAKPMPAKIQPKSPRAFEVLAVERDGDIYKAFWGGSQILVARYQGLPAVESVHIDAKCKLGIKGFRATAG